MTVEVTPSHRNVFGDLRYSDDRSGQVKRGIISHWIEDYGGCWAVVPENRSAVLYYYRPHELKPANVLDRLAQET